MLYKRNEGINVVTKLFEQNFWPDLCSQKKTDVENYYVAMLPKHEVIVMCPATRASLLVHTKLLLLFVKLTAIYLFKTIEYHYTSTMLLFLYYITYHLYHLYYKMKLSVCMYFCMYSNIWRNTARTALKQTPKIR